MTDPTLAVRRVAVTGAASGIGLATVDRLLGQGHSVVAIDRDARRLGDALPASDRCSPHAADVTRDDDVRAAVEQCRSRMGGLDGFVANAGIGFTGSVDETDPDAWDAVVRANLTSVYLAARHALPLMRASGAVGSFVAVASQYGLIGGRRSVAYCAAKGGVVAMTKALAIDAADAGVRVNAVCPGPIDTPMQVRALVAAGSVEHAQREVLARVPLARLGQPREVADVIVFLLSGAAAFVSGAVWSVDGGWTAG